MNEIDNITLNCFANKQQYEHVMKKNDFHNDKQFLSDPAFCISLIRSGAPVSAK